MPRGDLRNFGTRAAPPFKPRGTTAMMRKGDNVAGPRGRGTIPAPVKSAHGVQTVRSTPPAQKVSRKK